MSVYINDQLEWVRQAIDSICAGTRLPGEFLIYCDGPVTDELETVLDQYVEDSDSLIRVFKGEQNRGRAYARQFLVERAQGDYVMIMDADDISLLDRLEKQADFARLHPEVDVLGGYIEEFGSGMELRVREVPLDEASIRKRGKFLQPLNHVTIMAKKDAIQSVGGYRDAGDVEDYDLIARWLVAGKHIRNLPEILVSVRVDNGLLNRRRGWKHFQDELNVARYMRAMNYVSGPEFLLVAMGKFVARSLPAPLLGRVYSLLRRPG